MAVVDVPSPALSSNCEWLKQGGRIHSSLIYAQDWKSTAVISMSDSACTAQPNSGGLSESSITEVKKAHLSKDMINCSTSSWAERELKGWNTFLICQLNRQKQTCWGIEALEPQNNWDLEWLRWLYHKKMEIVITNPKTDAVIIAFWGRELSTTSRNTLMRWQNNLFFLWKSCF